MTTEDKKFISFVGNSSLLVVITAAVVLLITSSMGVRASQQTDEKPQEVKLQVEVSEPESKLSDEVLLKFYGEVETSLESKKEETIAAIEAQNEVLERIEAAVAVLIPSTPEEVEEVPEVTVPKVIARPDPIRMSSTTWNLKGKWGFNMAEIAEHLSEDHGVTDLSGYTFEQLKTIHDNLHNGYTAYGSTLQTRKPPVRVRSSRTFSVFPRLRTSSSASCPTGGCP